MFAMCLQYNLSDLRLFAAALWQWYTQFRYKGVEEFHMLTRNGDWQH